MKSFRLHIESISDITQSALGFFIGAGIVGLAYFFGIANPVLYTLLLLGAASFTGYLCRGTLCRMLKNQYPNARWTPLLAIGFSLCGFGALAQFLAPEGIRNTVILALLLPAGICIATFVVANKNDPDVMR